MQQSAIRIFALTVGVSLLLVVSAVELLGMSAGLKDGPAAGKDCVTVFLTGNELGALRPCGCSSGQLGGLERRPAILNAVPTQKKLIVDTGSLVDDDSEQNLLKFDIMVQAFNLLGYDVVNLNAKDIEIAASRGLLDNMASVFSLISSRGGGLPMKFTKQFSLNGKMLAVTIAAFDAESSPIEQIRELFAPQPDTQTVNILILNSCSADVIESISQTEIVDCIVCPPEADEAELLSDPDEKPLIISVGRFGRYIDRLQITADEDANEPNLVFLLLPVTEDLPQDKSLTGLYRTYQNLVKKENLLEKHPRFTLPNGLEYTGSKSCKSCHKYEYKKWSKKAHAHAYATLEKVNSQYDPECIICHVVGFEYQGGFVSQQQSSKNLWNVGCENCHGPGSEHIKTDGHALTAEPKSDCTDCHTPENSPRYAENEQLYFNKIIHWREPNAADDVKE